MRAPVFAAMRPASSRPFSRSAGPVMQQHRRLAGAQRARGVLHGVFGYARARGRGRHGRGPGALVPRGVAGQNQRRDLPGRRHRGGDRGGAVGRDGHRGRRGLHPAGERLGGGLDVGGERRIVVAVIGRVIAHDVDQRGRGLHGVVDVRQPVGEAGAEMEQRRRRLLGHARIAVGSAGRHALEQREHAAHAVDAVERGDEMHLRGAGVGEADIHAAADQRPHQTFRAVHLFSFAQIPVRPHDYL